MHSPVHCEFMLVAGKVILIINWCWIINSIYLPNRLFVFFLLFKTDFLIVFRFTVTKFSSINSMWVQFSVPPTRGQTDAVSVSAQLQQPALLEVALPLLHAGLLLVHLMDQDVQLPLHDVKLPLCQLLLPPPQLLLLLPLLLCRPGQRLLPGPQLLQTGRAEEEDGFWRSSVSFDIRFAAGLFLTCSNTSD